MNETALTFGMWFCAGLLWVWALKIAGFVASVLAARSASGLPVRWRMTRAKAEALADFYEGEVLRGDMDLREAWDAYKSAVGCVYYGTRGLARWAPDASRVNSRLCAAYLKAGMRVAVRMLWVPPTNSDGTPWYRLGIEKPRPEQVN